MLLSHRSYAICSFFIFLRRMFQFHSDVCGWRCQKLTSIWENLKLHSSICAREIKNIHTHTCHTNVEKKYQMRANQNINWCTSLDVIIIFIFSYSFRDAKSCQCLGFSYKLKSNVFSHNDSTIWLDFGIDVWVLFVASNDICVKWYEQIFPSNSRDVKKIRKTTANNVKWSKLDFLSIFFLLSRLSLALWKFETNLMCAQNTIPVCNKCVDARHVYSN